MKIEILGWYNNEITTKNNCGDESFKKYIYYVFRRHELSFITPPSKCTSNADMVVLGGGAVIAPYYLACIEDVKCPKYALGVSISYLSEMDLVKDTFNRLYLRDPSDVAEMRTKVSYPVDPIPDLSFFHTPSGGDIIKKYAPCTRRKALGVMLTDYVSPAVDRSFDEFGTRAHSFRTNLAEVLTMLHRAGWDIYMIPLSSGGYGNDIRVNLDVAAWMRETPIQIYDTLTPQDTIDLISQMDLTLCMKYHSVLFSVIAGVPFVSMAFTRKVELFLQEHNLKSLAGAQFVDNKDFDTSKLIDVVEATSQKPYLREKFINIADGYYRDLHKIADTIREEWLGD